jgi:peptidoglycan/xylan/chitin deacetylase (PgdA/CDA1 family)
VHSNVCIRSLETAGKARWSGIGIAQRLANHLYELLDRFPRIGVDQECPVILMWHDIQPHEVSVFSAQLEWLSKNRAIVTAEEIVASHHRGSVALSFDDGYASVYEVVLPLLEKFEIPATVFVASGFVGQPGHVSRQQLDVLAASPYVTVGAHTRTHARLGTLSATDQSSEVTGGKEDLEQMLGQPVSLFAYPFGKRSDVGSAGETISRDARFLAAFSTERGCLSDTCDRFWVPRVGVSGSFLVPQIEGFLNGLFWPADEVSRLARIFRGRCMTP